MAQLIDRFPWPLRIVPEILWWLAVAVKDLAVHISLNVAELGWWWVVGYWLLVLALFDLGGWGWEASNKALRGNDILEVEVRDGGSVRREWLQFHRYSYRNVDEALPGLGPYAPTVFRLGPAGRRPASGWHPGPQNPNGLASHVPRGMLQGLVGRGRRSEQDALPVLASHVLGEPALVVVLDAFGDDADSQRVAQIAQHAGQRFGAWVVDRRVQEGPIEFDQVQRQGAQTRQ